MAILTNATHPALRVFDANGVELHGVTWCNTKTGEAVQIVRNSDGTYPYTFKERRQHPAPLRVEVRRLVAIGPTSAASR